MDWQYQYVILRRQRNPDEPPHDVRIEVARSGFPLAPDFESGVGSDSSGVSVILAIIVFPVGWVVCRLINIVRFKGSWTEGTVTTRRSWSWPKVTSRERFPTKAEAQERAEALEAALPAKTISLPGKR